MSYCRWSSDDFACDLYCYADGRGGFTTHVATHRYTGDIPAVDRSTAERFAETAIVQLQALRPDRMKPIGFAHDGATFRVATREELRALIVDLRGAGYRVPADVIPAIDAEIAEEVVRQ